MTAIIDKKVSSLSKFGSYNIRQTSLADQVVDLLKNNITVKNGRPSAEDIFIEYETFQKLLSLVEDLDAEKLETTITNASLDLYDDSLDLIAIAHLDGNNLATGLLAKVNEALKYHKKNFPKNAGPDSRSAANRTQGTNLARPLIKIQAKTKEPERTRGIYVDREKISVPGLDDIDLGSEGFDWQNYFTNGGARETLEVLYEVLGERVYDESLAHDLKKLGLLQKLQYQFAKRVNLGNLLRRLVPAEELLIKNPNISDENRARIKKTISGKIQGSDWDPEKLLNALLAKVGLARVQKERIQKIQNRPIIS